MEKRREGDRFAIGSEAKDCSPARYLADLFTCKLLIILSHGSTHDFLANATSLHDHALPVFLMDTVSPIKVSAADAETFIG